MAMEKVFCPSDEFKRYVEVFNLEEESEVWPRIRELLGVRVNFMEYTPGGYSCGDWCYAVDCIAGSTSFLGVEIAAILKAICSEKGDMYGGRKILLTDVNNPLQIPGVRVNSVENNGRIGDTKYLTDEDESLCILEDRHYYVGIRNANTEHVHVYFFKKDE